MKLRGYSPGFSLTGALQSRSKPIRAAVKEKETATTLFTILHIIDEQLIIMVRIVSNQYYIMYMESIIYIYIIDC